MNDVADAVRPLIRTRQYREFASEPVTEEQLRALAEVARWTGSGGNSQPWRFVVVRNVDVLRQVAEIAMPQGRALSSAMAANAISLPAEANAEVITAYDEGRCVERIVVGATLLGLGAGICWIREHAWREIHQLLEIADDRHVRTIIGIGHPTEQARAFRSQRGEARLPLEELVSWRQ